MKPIKYIWQANFITVFSSSSGSERYELEPKTQKRFFITDQGSLDALKTAIEQSLDRQTRLTEFIDAKFIGMGYLHLNTLDQNKDER